ncbi:MAG: type IV secretion system DNA-binding domain-containing protein, partial [Chloroflexota bacterium]|nr:type IV secretion system DNA-binding domain-containing protein [Chloroflexota bacterium]
EHDRALNATLIALAVAGAAFLLFPAGLAGLLAPLLLWWLSRGPHTIPRSSAWGLMVPVVAWLWWPMRGGWEAAIFAHVAVQLAYLPRLPDMDGALLLAWARDTLHPGLPLGLLVGLAGVGLGLTGTQGRGTTAPVAEERHPEPPAIPRAVVAKAHKGEVPTVVSGRLRKGVVPSLPIGYGPKGEPVCLTGPQMTHHGLVVGLTGAGKTTFMAEQIRAARALGWSVVCLDLKGSPSLRRLFYGLEGGVVWTPNGPATLDLLRGKPDEVAAKIVSVAGTVTGQQYNQIAQGCLTEIVKAIDATSEGRTFTGVQARLLAAVEAAGRHPQQALVDLEARLRTVTTSSAEPYLRPGEGAINLERSVRDGGAVLLSIPVPRLRLVGEKLGAWALADANRVASRLTATDWGAKTGKRCLLLVDEFAGLKEQGAHVAQPLAMVREGGVSIWLYTQTLSGLKRLGDVAYSEILGNVNVQVVMRQSEPDDQAALSELLGEYATQEFSRSLDGETGEGTGDFRPKSVTKPYVTPGQIAALPVGQAYVRIAGGKPVAVVIPRVADGDGEEADPETEDDDGTPVVRAVVRPIVPTPTPAAVATPSVASPAPTPGPTPGPFQDKEGGDGRLF